MSDTGKITGLGAISYAGGVVLYAAQAKPLIDAAIDDPHLTCALVPGAGPAAGNRLFIF